MQTAPKQQIVCFMSDKCLDGVPSKIDPYVERPVVERSRGYIEFLAKIFLPVGCTGINYTCIVI